MYLASHACIFPVDTYAYKTDINFCSRLTEAEAKLNVQHSFMYYIKLQVPKYSVNSLDILREKDLMHRYISETS